MILPTAAIAAGITVVALPDEVVAKIRAGVRMVAGDIIACVEDPNLMDRLMALPGRRPPRHLAGAVGRTVPEADGPRRW
ncbi:hypothetical protein ACFY4C_17115 [Actinomadura viridis]|uniref:hypothetical protein n=1 Tax=Actinomadura viridis TaxID=58110 RepID=UPI0036AC760D